eukprot:TRINITY_DN4231_c1_g1_i4.p3 TRINITY_DN4231_c1_g1~~TRINITY_DN4231_c1_g1_i4.p3  ORF type:complete len:160 (-),score=19.74 TRINITY_DN4231_c1_g1_i4:298-777(-)
MQSGEGSDTVQSKDFEKLSELSKKITEELSVIQDKLQNTEEEVVRFSDLEGLQKEHQQSKIDLEEEQQNCKEQHQKLQDGLRENKNRLEEITVALKKNPQYSQIDKLDTQIQKIKKNNNQIQQFIKNKIGQSDYESVIEDLESITDDINQQLMQSLIVY